MFPLGSPRAVCPDDSSAGAGSFFWKWEMGIQIPRGYQMLLWGVLCPNSMHNAGLSKMRLKTKGHKYKKSKKTVEDYEANETAMNMWQKGKQPMKILKLRETREHLRNHKKIEHWKNKPKIRQKIECNENHGNNKGNCRKPKEIWGNQLQSQKDNTNQQRETIIIPKLIPQTE